MSWLGRKRRIKSLRSGTATDEWVTVPFRFAEAARVSIYNIGAQKDIPDHLRWWISYWLDSYNSQLISYMRDAYGPEIFPLLDKITESVMLPTTTSAAAKTSESWDKWEQQFRDEEGS